MESIDSRLRISAATSSRLFAACCLIHAVPNVAAPPTSEPSTPAIALTIVESIAGKNCRQSAMPLLHGPAEAQCYFPADAAGGAGDDTDLVTQLHS